MDTTLLKTLERNKQRFAALCYRFQEERLSSAKLLVNFQAVCRRYHVSVPDIDLGPFPLYAFVRTGKVLRMVPQPCIEGGAGWNSGAFVRFSTETVHEAIVLRVEGELDLSAANEFADAIESAYRENERVIVDLSRLDYLDGSGIRVLMRFAEEARGRFVVVGSKPSVHRLFVILKLHDALPVVSSLGAARQYLGPQ